ncbi:hypothetical protein HK104_007430, partial [Borealophlyctis nickersoniae]
MSYHHHYQPPNHTPPSPRTLNPTPPYTPPPRSNSRLSETYDELEKMLNDIKTPHQVSKAEKVYMKGEQAFENSLASITEAQGKMAKVKTAGAAAYDLANQATGGDFGAAVSNVLQNPALERCINIANQLVDVGKHVPFVAPIFVVLKIIIDVEQKARDAASKCNDLLERINFMTSQLLVLKKVQILDTTRDVIKRMEKVLKDAASLITSYRKQSAIARRLNMGNKDKFIGAVGSIKAVTDDLMISLQIQQTTTLDILQRSVPKDPEDEAAEAFVKEHGGEEAVKNNPDLVRQFAQQIHVTVDEAALSSLHRSISDLMLESQTAIEASLRENVTSAVAEGLKGYAAEVAAAELAKEKEERKQCVQCKEEYRDSVNTAVACTFHKTSDTQGRSGEHSCCGEVKPCQRNWHRSKHHCEYPYAAFFERSGNILKYTDTVDWYIDLEEKDMDDETKEQMVAVGKLLRWGTRLQRVDEPILVVRVGSVWYKSPHYFATLEPSELAEMAFDQEIDDVLIFRTQPGEAYAMAEWIKDGNGMVVGCRCTTKVASSRRPTVHEVMFDPMTLEMVGEVKVVSEGGFKPYKPLTPYVVPETVRYGVTLTGKPVRKPRTDFKTVASSPDISCVISPSSDPPLRANPKWAHPTKDTFIGTVTIFNKSSDVTIASATASWRLVGDKEWKDPMSFALTDPEVLPTNIGPKQTQTFSFETAVPRSEEEVAHDIKWWDRAYIARHRPLRLKLVFKTIDGETCSTILEYVFTPYKIEEPKDDQLAFFFFDDPEQLCRNSVAVSASTWNDEVITLPTKRLTVTDLNKLVYTAMKTGKTEVDIQINATFSSSRTDYWNAWALVDLNCQRVYALKFILRQGKEVEKPCRGCIGYVLVPEYGESEERREVMYAVEEVKLEGVGEETWKGFVDEDGWDDIVVEVPKSVVDVKDAAPTNGVGVAAAGGAGGVVVGGPVSLAIPEEVTTHLATFSTTLETLTAIPKTLDTRLTSIDKTLTTLATATTTITPTLDTRLASIDTHLTTLIKTVAIPAPPQKPAPADPTTTHIEKHL